MKVYFTRHSTTIWNQEHRLQGWKNSALTKEGKEDAKRLGERMKEEIIDICYTSPLERAKNTAMMIFDTIPIIIEERLKEFNFGDFEGQKVSDIKNEPIYYDLCHNPSKTLRIPHGESLQEVFDRVESCIAMLYQKHANETIFITTHGIICIVLLTIIQELPINEMMKNNTVVRGCSLHCFSFNGEKYKLIFSNDTSHLSLSDIAITYHK
jgi:probable phosphoglycerate mutase